MKFVGLSAVIIASTICGTEGHDHTLNFKCEDVFCYTLMGIGCVFAAFLIFMMPVCVAYLCLAAKAIKVLSQNVQRFTPTRDNNLSNVEQNGQERPRVEIQGAPQVCTVDNLGPEYDTVQNERGDYPKQPADPVHYFELEQLPSNVNRSGAEDRQRKPTKGSSSVLHSLQDLPTQGSHGIGYDELTGPGHPTASILPKMSAASLPPTAVPYSSIENAGTPEGEKENPNETAHIYSMPDVRKKKKMRQKGDGQREKENEMRRSRTMDSFFSSAPQSKATSLDDLKDKGEQTLSRQATPSPPPPMLPPKPGHKNILTDSDNDDLENTESLYSEASSKPLQPHAPSKDEDKLHASKKTEATPAMGTFSPHHYGTGKVTSREREFGHIPRSFSTMGHSGKRGTPLATRQVADTEFRQLYDMPLDLFLSYKDESARRTAKLAETKEAKT